MPSARRMRWPLAALSRARWSCLALPTSTVVLAPPSWHSLPAAGSRAASTPARADRRVLTLVPMVGTGAVAGPAAGAAAERGAPPGPSLTTRANDSATRPVTARAAAARAARPGRVGCSDIDPPDGRGLVPAPHPPAVPQAQGQGHGGHGQDQQPEQRRGVEPEEVAQLVGRGQPAPGHLPAAGAVGLDPHPGQPGRAGEPLDGLLPAPARDQIVQHQGAADVAAEADAGVGGPQDGVAGDPVAPGVLGSDAAERALDEVAAGLVPAGALGQVDAELGAGQDLVPADHPAGRGPFEVEADVAALDPVAGDLVAGTAVQVDPWALDVADGVALDRVGPAVAHLDAGGAALDGVAPEPVAAAAVHDQPGDGVVGGGVGDDGVLGRPGRGGRAVAEHDAALAVADGVVALEQVVAAAAGEQEAVAAVAGGGVAVEDQGHTAAVGVEPVAVVGQELVAGPAHVRG